MPNSHRRFHEDEQIEVFKGPHNSMIFKLSIATATNPLVSTVEIEAAPDSEGACVTIGIAPVHSQTLKNKKVDFARLMMEALGPLPDPAHPYNHYHAQHPCYDPRSQGTYVVVVDDQNLQDWKHRRAQFMHNLAALPLDAATLTLLDEVFSALQQGLLTKPEKDQKQILALLGTAITDGRRLPEKEWTLPYNQIM